MPFGVMHFMQERTSLGKTTRPRQKGQDGLVTNNPYPPVFGKGKSQQSAIQDLAGTKVADFLEEIGGVCAFSAHGQTKRVETNA